MPRAISTVTATAITSDTAVSSLIQTRPLNLASGVLMSRSMVLGPAIVDQGMEVEGSHALSVVAAGAIFRLQLALDVLLGLEFDILPSRTVADLATGFGHLWRLLLGDEATGFAITGGMAFVALFISASLKAWLMRLTLSKELTFFEVAL